MAAEEVVCVSAGEGGVGMDRRILPVDPPFYRLLKPTYALDCESKPVMKSLVVEPAQ